MTDWSKRHLDENDIPKLVRELPRVEADEGFRRRLRSRFTEGRLDVEPVGAEPSGEGRPLLRLLRWPVVVAAAALVLITVVMLNRPANLRIAQVVGQGEVRADGRTIDLADQNALAAGIRAGAEIEVPPEVLIDLISGNVVLFEIAGGTRMSIPPMPGRWFSRDVACSLFVGEIRIKTGKDFPGSELLVYTPEGIVEITGTLLSVQRDEGGTCVCVLEGVALVGVDEDDMQQVKPGYRKVMYSDGTQEILSIKPMHRDGVLDFDERVGDRIERGR
jgi:hypothetical protein